MSSLISIIIPVYNHAATIERSFASIVKQVYRPIEVIVVDDGSTDDPSPQFSVLSTQSRVAGVPLKIVRQENRGAGAARNRGFQESKGEYVIFWDADTVAEPEMLEKMATQLLQHPEASYAYSQFKFGWKTMRSQPFNIGDLKKCNYIDTTSLLRREDFFGFDESLKRFQDWDLWLTLLEKGKKGIFIPEVLFKKIVSGRKGMSSWLPSGWYRLPWKSKKVKNYEAARMIVLSKHHLN